MCAVASVRCTFTRTLTQRSRTNDNKAGIGRSHVSIKGPRVRLGVDVNRMSHGRVQGRHDGTGCKSNESAREMIPPELERKAHDYHSTLVEVWVFGAMWKIGSLMCSISWEFGECLRVGFSRGQLLRTHTAGRSRHSSSDRWVGRTADDVSTLESYRCRTRSVDLQVRS